MERVHNGIRIRRPKKKRNIWNEVRIKWFNSGAYRLHTDAVLARHVPQPRRAHTEAFQFAPDASDDDDAIDAVPAEPTHASSSATSTSAAGEDVSTSTQPSVTMSFAHSIACICKKILGLVISNKKSSAIKLCSCAFR